MITPIWLRVKHVLAICAVTSASAMLYACQTIPSACLPIAKNDRVNPWLGPQKHYEHVVRDKDGRIREVYRYYFDVRGKPVLDGPRVIYRWEHDPGRTILYRDGRVIREADNIVTG